MVTTDRGDDPIRHVVVLLLENHSFDQMLGSLKQLYPDLDGVDPNRLGQNQYEGKTYTQAPTSEREMLLDPHHEVNHVATQLSGNNGGFVRDFVECYPQSNDVERGYIMGYY